MTHEQAEPSAEAIEAVRASEAFARPDSPFEAILARTLDSFARAAERRAVESVAAHFEAQIGCHSINHSDAYMDREDAYLQRFANTSAPLSPTC